MSVHALLMRARAAYYIYWQRFAGRADYKHNNNNNYKNHVGCRDDTMPKNCRYKKALRGGLQQSSATLKTKDVGIGLRKIVVSILLAVPSGIYSFWHGVIPTSYFIFILVLLIFMQA